MSMLGMTDAAVASRTREIWRERMDDLCRYTDRMFAVLMLLQWAGAIILALVVSPRTWIGTTSTVHLHVWAAILLGAALNTLPLYLVLRHPGRPITRHVIAVAQMIWSAILIHLTGGRIETHFHVFGSLAFLAFYRDWRVLVTASTVVALDHWARGVWWPQSVFGVLASSPYRWVEHAAWVGFGDVFLTLSCLRGQREMEQASQRQAELERENGQRQEAERQIEKFNIELQQRNDEMQQFIYTVSHDLKSPIVTCTGFLGMMREEIAAGHFDGLEDSIRRVERAAQRMYQSIEDLLELSRLGRMPNEPRPVDTDAVVRELIEELAPRIRPRGLTVRVQSTLPSIVADPARLTVAFENLLTNAIKYGCPRAGMAVQVGAVKVDAEVRFYVRDEGPGIAPAYHRKVFGLFQRLDARQEGTGVGLTIVQRIVEIHGGRVWIDSQPGQGACFWIAFPATPLAKSCPDAPHPPPLANAA